MVTRRNLLRGVPAGAAALTAAQAFSPNSKSEMLTPRSLHSKERRGEDLPRIALRPMNAGAQLHSIFASSFVGSLLAGQPHRDQLNLLVGSAATLLMEMDDMGFHELAPLMTANGPLVTGFAQNMPSKNQVMQEITARLKLGTALPPEFQESLPEIGSEILMDFTPEKFLQLHTQGVLLLANASDEPAATRALYNNMEGFRIRKVQQTPNTCGTTPSSPNCNARPAQPPSPGNYFAGGGTVAAIGTGMISQAGTIAGVGTAMGWYGTAGMATATAVITSGGIVLVVAGATIVAYGLYYMLKNQNSGIRTF